MGSTWEGADASADGGDSLGPPPTCILIVDDDSSIQLVLASDLEQRNMLAMMATREQDVVRLFGGTGPSAVLLDLRLGQDDGLDLLRAIRARSDVPIIMMTDTSVTSLIALSDWNWSRTITSQSRSVLTNSLVQCQTESAYAVPK